MITNIESLKELNERLSNNKYVIIDFEAEWCGPCKALKPLLDEISETFTDITFINIDVDKFKNIAEQYGISAIPTIIYFKDGQELSDRTFGFIPKPKLITNLNNFKNER